MEVQQISSSRTLSFYLLLVAVSEEDFYGGKRADILDSFLGDFDLVVFDVIFSLACQKEVETISHSL